MLHLCPVEYVDSLKVNSVPKSLSDPPLPLRIGGGMNWRQRFPVKVSRRALTSVSLAYHWLERRFQVEDHVLVCSRDS